MKTGKLTIFIFGTLLLGGIGAYIYYNQPEKDTDYPETVNPKIVKRPIKDEPAKPDTNKIAGEKFLKENAKRNEVKVTESGLQYQVLKLGSGPKPKATSVVKVHYHGTNIYGKVFDSSLDRGEPVDFTLNQVIPGWTEGLQLMSIGSKYRFFIPQELAYGPGSISKEIPPYSCLIFEVQLLGFTN